MFEYGVPHVVVPWLVLPAAIVAEAIALVVLLRQRPTRAFTAAAKAGLYSAFWVVVLMILAQICIPSRFDDKDQWMLFCSLYGPATAVSMVVLLPGFLVAWWLKHGTIRRDFQVSAGTPIRRATFQSHLIATASMIAAGVLSQSLWPVHGTYGLRVRVSEALSTATAARTMLAEFWWQRGRFPTSAELPEASYSTPDSKVTLEAGGRLIVRLVAPEFRELDGKAMVLAIDPSYDDGNSTRWLCGTSEIPVLLMPSECHNPAPPPSVGAAQQARPGS